MKLGSETIEILKNFSGIYGSIAIKPGNQLATKTPSNSMLVVASLKDTFPSEVYIYELNKFLGVMSLMNDPELDFAQTHLTVKSGDHSVFYPYCTPDEVKSPDRDSIAGPVSVEFEIKADALKKIVQATTVLKLDAIAIIGDDETIALQALHRKEARADTYRIEAGTTDKTFKFVLELDLINKLLLRDYTIAVSPKGFVRFTAEDVTYYIAPDRNTSNKGDL